MVGQQSPRLRALTATLMLAMAAALWLPDVGGRSGWAAASTQADRRAGPRRMGRQLDLE